MLDHSGMDGEELELEGCLIVRGSTRISQFRAASNF